MRYEVEVEFADCVVRYDADGITVAKERLSLTTGEIMLYTKVGGQFPALLDAIQAALEPHTKAQDRPGYIDWSARYAHQDFLHPEWRLVAVTGVPSIVRGKYVAADRGSHGRMIYGYRLPDGSMKWDKEKRSSLPFHCLMYGIQALYARCHSVN